MILSSRSIVVGFLAAVSTTALVMACGSDDESKFGNGKPVTPQFGNSDGGLYSEAGDDPTGKLYADDPPPAWCGADSGPQPTQVTGTIECPDDKNKPGCGCKTVGEEANCWTGLRKNRNLGGCKDGRTVCKKLSENENVWGECLGQKLPVPNATGEAACSCFSIGLWKIDNTAPCVWTPDGNTYYAYSTLPPAKEGDGPGKCTTADHLESGQKTTENWSKDRLTTDCAGSFTLCYRVRVGDYKNPSPNDCIMGESCVFADYQESGKEQELPPLPSWNTTDSACVKKWEKDTPDNVSPGYGEMIVKGGQTVRCESLSDVPKDQEFVFNRVQYCPKVCRDPVTAAANKELCEECQLKGRGEF